MILPANLFDMNLKIRDREYFKNSCYSKCLNKASLHCVSVSS